jgi:hypothetical protein
MLIYSALREMPRYIKRKDWRGGGIFAFFWLTALAISIYMSLGFKRPLLNRIIYNFIKEMFPFITKLS